MPSSRSSARSALLAAGVLACIGLIVFRSQTRSASRPAAAGSPPYSVEDRVAQYGDAVRDRLQPYFQRAGVSYPPAALVLVGLKQEKTLQIYAPGGNGKFRLVRSYSILAASGHAGPKLREGDLQVPEGLYRIESLNPNSLYHLSLRVNYPNDLDRAQAGREHRENLGGDIMIHGSDASIGCLAMGDETAEELFVLAALTGIEHIQVILCPVDFRVPGNEAIQADVPPWIKGVYEQIKAELEKYPVGTCGG